MPKNQEEKDREIAEVAADLARLARARGVAVPEGADPEAILAALAGSPGQRGNLPPGLSELVAKLGRLMARIDAALR